MTSKPMARFQALFAELGPDRPMDLDRVYTSDIVFQDPFHRIEGRAALAEYFARMNGNIESCTFEFRDVVENANEGFSTWTMRLKTKRGPRGVVEVEGTSHLHYRGDEISSHRDYFDAAALVYEHVPLLGGAIRAIRKRM